MTKLQVKNLLISQQKKRVGHLSATLSAWIVIELNSADFDNSTHYISGRWAVNYQNVINYIFDRGIFIQNIYLNNCNSSTSFEAG